MIIQYLPDVVDGYGKNTFMRDNLALIQYFRGMC